MRSARANFAIAWNSSRKTVGPSVHVTAMRGKNRPKPRKNEPSDRTSQRRPFFSFFFAQPQRLIPLALAPHRTNDFAKLSATALASGFGTLLLYICEPDQHC